MKRFGYYIQTYLFDPKDSTSIIKSNLLWLIGLTFMLEVVASSRIYEVGESVSYFDGMLAHSPLILIMKLLTLAFM